RASVHCRTVCAACRIPPAGACACTTTSHSPALRAGRSARGSPDAPCVAIGDIATHNAAMPAALHAHLPIDDSPVLDTHAPAPAACAAAIGSGTPDSPGWAATNGSHDGDGFPCGGHSIDGTREIHARRLTSPARCREVLSANVSWRRGAP